MAFANQNRIIGNFEPFLLKLIPPVFFCSYVECFVVFLHYRWNEVLFAALIVSTLSGYFADEEAICVNKFDRSDVSTEMKDICITYPYSVQSDGTGESVRVYALHYKWIPYIFALALLLSFTLELYVKKIEDKTTKSFLQSLISHTLEEQNFDICQTYFTKHIGRHGHLPQLR